MKVRKSSQGGQESNLGQLFGQKQTTNVFQQAASQPLKSMFGLKPDDQSNVVACSPAFGESSNRVVEPVRKLTDKIDSNNKNIIAPIAIKPLATSLVFSKPVIAEEEQKQEKPDVIV